jgi:hypothetical protein
VNQAVGQEFGSAPTISADLATRSRMDPETKTGGSACGAAGLGTTGAEVAAVFSLPFRPSIATGGPAAQGRARLDRAMVENLHRRSVLVGLSPG